MTFKKGKMWFPKIPTNDPQISPASQALIRQMFKDLKKKDNEDNQYALDHSKPHWIEWFDRNYDMKCQHCGKRAEQSGRRLSWHHNDPKKKNFGIGSYIESHMCASGNIPTMREEVELCTLLCSSCHLKEHRRMESEVPA
jgi:hypothetical protein